MIDDYKSIALPIELWGLEQLIKLNLIIIQVYSDN